MNCFINPKGFRKDFEICELYTMIFALPSLKIQLAFLQNSFPKGLERLDLSFSGIKEGRPSREIRRSLIKIFPYVTDELTLFNGSISNSFLKSILANLSKNIGLEFKNCRFEGKELSIPDTVQCELRNLHLGNCSNSDNFLSGISPEQFFIILSSICRSHLSKTIHSWSYSGDNDQRDKLVDLLDTEVKGLFTHDTIYYPPQIAIIEIILKKK